MNIEYSLEALLLSFLVTKKHEFNTMNVPGNIGTCITIYSLLYVDIIINTL